MNPHIMDFVTGVSVDDRGELVLEVSEGWDKIFPHAERRYNYFPYPEEGGGYYFAEGAGMASFFYEDTRATHGRLRMGPITMVDGSTKHIQGGWSGNPRSLHLASGRSVVTVIFVHGKWRYQGCVNMDTCILIALKYHSIGHTRVDGLRRIMERSPKVMEHGLDNMYRVTLDNAKKYGRVI